MDYIRTGGLTAVDYKIFLTQLCTQLLIGIQKICQMIIAIVRTSDELEFPARHKHIIIIIIRYIFSLPSIPAINYIANVYFRIRDINMWRIRKSPTHVARVKCYTTTLKYVRNIYSS